MTNKLTNWLAEPDHDDDSDDMLAPSLVILGLLLLGLAASTILLMLTIGAQQ